MKFLTNLFTKKEVLKKIENGQKKIYNVYETEEKIIAQLEICKKISNHHTTKTLLTMWLDEYEKIRDEISTIENIEAEIEIYIEKNKFKKAIKSIFDNTKTFDEILAKEEKFLEKIIKYTEFEQDSTKMSLNLKERLKSLNIQFDQTLKLFDVYTPSVIEKTAEINYKIQEFEDTQISGEFPKAREFLRAGNDILEKLEVEMKVLISDWEKFTQIETNIDSISKTSEKVKVLGYTKLSKNLKEKFIPLKVQKDEMEVLLKKFNFNSENLKEQNLNSQKLNTFYEEVKQESSEVFKTFEIIKNMNKYEQLNVSLLKVVTKLIEGAVEEKNVIVKLYNLDEKFKVSLIDKEYELFQVFKKDYTELKKLILDSQNNFEKMEQKIIQSNKYLNRVLEKINREIKKLAAIRRDELEIRGKVDTYMSELISVDMFLHEQKHSQKMSKSLRNNINEIEQKLEKMVKCLEAETLDISYARTMNEVIEKLITKLVVDAQSDIKQRKGVEKLIVYFNRFILNEEMLNHHQHFLTLYNEYDYKKILRDIHNLFIEINPKGDELYKRIVGQIVIDEYKGSL